jgi:hypothetical protein
LIESFNMYRNPPYNRSLAIVVETMDNDVEMKDAAVIEGKDERVDVQ